MSNISCHTALISNGIRQTKHALRTNTSHKHGSPTYGRWLSSVTDAKRSWKYGSVR